MTDVHARRLRSSSAIRRLVRETRIHPESLVLPVFVKEGLDQPQQISSLPGVFQHSLESVKSVVDQAISAGIGGIMIFAIPERRDALGSEALNPRGILARATQVVSAHAAGRLAVMVDVCLDEFTDHGHCGVLTDEGVVDNDATNLCYAQMSVILANKGAGVVALSGMMDGQVAVVRRALDDAGKLDTAILAYSAKYASAFYGPFRQAVDSTFTGDRKTYQLDPANGREGLKEAVLDQAEGADIVMVKPALPYLDVLAEVAGQSLVPVAAYHVSGEYSQIEAAAQLGWIDRRDAHLEAIQSCVRAGADIVVTYAALDIVRWLGEK